LGDGLLRGDARAASQLLPRSLRHSEDAGTVNPGESLWLHPWDREMLWGGRRDFLPGSQERKWRDG